MTDAQKQFVERVDKSEKRYKGHKYATHFLMPRELLIEVRDELRSPKLFVDETKKVAANG